MTPRPRHAHYLKPLKRAAIPDLHIVLNTDAQISRRGRRYRHEFSYGHAIELRRNDEDGWDAGDHIETVNAQLLWGWIDRHLGSERKAVIWAHNMPYDLRVSAAMRHLLDLGWRCEAISLARISSWCSWAKGKHKLTICDSYSWLHASLDGIARQLGVPVVTDAQLAARTATTVDRCVAETVVLSSVVQELLGWLAAENLGPLRPTGSGQSHAAWRKRWLPERKVLIHDDLEQLQRERAAMHSGRCEAWQHGKIARPLYEWDLSLAYCRIAVQHPLPCKLLGELPTRDDVHQLAYGGQRAVLAEVDVQTELPLVPAAHEGRVLWPVGSFRTTLWDPELVLLAKHGAVVRVRRAWLYETSTALAGMAGWIVRQLQGDGGPVGPVQRRVLKHWARTLVGRCALRYAEWEHVGISPWENLELGYRIHDDYNGETAYLQVGRDIFEASEVREANSSCPAIPGWVMSACRVQLWRLVEIAGPREVAYLDTDGLLVSGVGDSRLKGWRRPLGFSMPLRKGVYRNVTIYGPRQVDLGAERRISGIPKGAIRKSEITWEGEMWEGLETALANGSHDHVNVSEQAWQLTPTDRRRQHQPDGTTTPIRLE